MRISLKNKKVRRAGRHLGKAFVLMLKRSLGLSTPPVILAYRGHGTPHDVFLSGHVLDDRLLYEPAADDSTWSNIRAMLSRFVSTSIPGATVTIEAFGKKYEVETDKHGYFSCHVRPEQKLAGGWYQIQYKVDNTLEEGPEELLSNSDALIVDEQQVAFGVISDVDDTIIISYANRLLRKLRLILTKNAHTRLPFPGVAEFYQALREPHQKEGPNPIFYVSSSEWNLYDFLIDFCQKQNIPRGVFFLQELNEISHRCSVRGAVPIIINWTKPGVYCNFIHPSLLSLLVIRASGMLNCTPAWLKITRNEYCPFTYGRLRAVHDARILCIFTSLLRIAKIKSAFRQKRAKPRSMLFKKDLLPKKAWIGYKILWRNRKYLLPKSSRSLCQLEPI